MKTCQCSLHQTFPCLFLELFFFPHPLSMALGLTQKLISHFCAHSHGPDGPMLMLSVANLLWVKIVCSSQSPRHTAPLQYHAWTIWWLVFSVSSLLQLILFKDHHCHATLRQFLCPSRESEPPKISYLLFRLKVHCPPP